MKGHTKGPWEKGSRKVLDDVFDREEYEIYPTHDELGPIAIVGDEADANLIVAAPDLLGALQNLVAIVGWDIVAHDEIKAARAAIAKAEGMAP